MQNESQHIFGPLFVRFEILTPKKLRRFYTRIPSRKMPKELSLLLFFFVMLPTSIFIWLALKKLSTEDVEKKFEKLSGAYKISCKDIIVAHAWQAIVGGSTRTSLMTYIGAKSLLKKSFLKFFF